MVSLLLLITIRSLKSMSFIEVNILSNIDTGISSDQMTPIIIELIVLTCQLCINMTIIRFKSL